MKFKDAINKIRPKIDNDFREGVRFLFLLICSILSATLVITLMWQLWGGVYVAFTLLTLIGYLGFGTQSDRGAK